MILRAEALRREFMTDSATVVPVAAASVSVAAGETVAICGPSGSGKSTLLGLLGLLLEPTSGQLTIAGEGIDPADRRQRARLRATTIGFVFQLHHLLAERTCLENVLLGATYSGRRRSLTRDALALLETVGLGDRRDDLAAQLSGGEAQRVAICRALVNDPALLLCDEPTGNLDSANRDAVLDLLIGSVRPARGVVIVTHDPEVAERCDRRIEFVDGRCVADTGALA